MVYIGSKNRLSKDIIKFIEPYYNDKVNYYEPFVGGANMIDKIPKNVFKNIIGNDFNKYLIALLNYMKTDNEIEYEFIEKEDWYNNYLYPFREGKLDGKYKDWYIGYIGFTKTFSSKFMKGYCGKNKDLKDIQRGPHNNILKQRENIKHIKFIYGDYKDMIIENNSVVYLDPPYSNTIKYEVDIFHEEFYEWCRNLVNNKNCIVFVSEYNMPEDFECIFEKEYKQTLSANGKTTKAVEKLFILKKDLK